MSINMQEWRDETTAIVNELLADEDKRDRFGKAGRKRVEDVFSWRSIAKTTADYYEGVVKKFRSKK